MALFSQSGKGCFGLAPGLAGPEGNLRQFTLDGNTRTGGGM